MEYQKYFEESWRELCEMAKEGKFTPNQEQDVICMLYHLCLQKLGDPRLIHPWTSQNFDIVLGETKATQRQDQDFGDCLIAEVKFIERRERKGIRLKRALEDIRDLLEKEPPTRTIFAMYDKANCLTKQEKDRLKRESKVKSLYGPKSS